MRLISYWDEEKQRTLKFMTNNFDLDAQTIADIYKARWAIEAFFKWIKQNLKIKTFLGTRIAMCYYLLLAYIKFQSRYAHSLFYLHRIVKEALLKPLTLIDLLSLNERRMARIHDPDPQLCFGF
ncbi:MAG: transposase [Elusimicrobia bacterium]|nr:transposase [Elusimicrobiota bacterium]